MTDPRSRTSLPRASNVSRRVATAGALVAASLVAVMSSGAQPAGTGGQAARTYVVQMVLDPVVAYEGEVAGLPATRPGKGEKIDPSSPRVVKYVDHLAASHDAALARVGGGEKLYDFAYSYDGFAARLTEAQAAALEGLEDVLSVTPDELQTVDTSSTPAFLGLDAPGGLWSRLGGPVGAKGGRGAGDGVVVGVVDTGIWPASKSFTDRDASGKLVFQQIPGFHGKCESSETVTDGSWDAALCNKKLVAARHFDAAWGGDAGIKAERPWEFTSPRDYNGHGTHTASTAAGNHDVQTTGAAAVFGPISGIAPRARIAAYKALWSTRDGSSAGGFTSDLVAAIDQAVADGVDVISYSVSGTTTNFLEPVQMAFLFAAEAGVFVSASAGNSGPASGTVAHPGPWLTTVAAGTHDREGQGSVTLGNGTAYAGASAAEAAGPAPLIDSTAAGLPGANATRVARCYAASDNGGAPVLDPAKVAGRIVLCDRGDTARGNKSLAVAEAGGIGMILANTSPSSLDADLHFVPTVHIAHTDRAAVKAYAGSPGATATIEHATIRYDAPAPSTASFSSRGPLRAGGGDLLKPDVIAPGQDILAAVAPPGNHGRSFNLASGTSMSAPHVAGLAALLKQLHRGWSPMAIKSALMTSGADVLDGEGTHPGVIFSQGAGHVAPNGAADPGLVYDSGLEDWLAFLCGTTSGVGPSTCDELSEAGYSLDPSDLNTPSIAIGRLAGVQTVTRNVTNVGRTTATYTASITELSGITATVSPSTLTIDPGRTASFTVAFTRTTAPPTGYSGGRLTWSDGAHTVRSPIVIRPIRQAEERWAVRALHGGPTFDASTQSGFIQPQLPIRPGKTAGSGLGVGSALRIEDFAGKGTRALRWDADGWDELGGLGFDTNGNFQSFVYATTPAGTAVGNAFQYAPGGSQLGTRPVRWDAGSATAVELEGLGTSSTGTSFGSGTAVNSGGTVAGDVAKYLPDGTDLGRRAVRWEAGGTAVTELGHIGVNAGGQTNNWAYAINEAGDIVGYGLKRDGSSQYGTRAIRWDADSTAATELGNLGLDGNGATFAQAFDINERGAVVGHANRYDEGVSKGQRPVRWEAGGTAATELDALGANSSGAANASAYAVNDAGVTVGVSTRFDESGASLGNRAARWDAAGTAVTELEQLEVTPAGHARSTAFDVNNDGLAVGTAFNYSEQIPGIPGDRAVMWTADGSIVDLTSLLPADSGWTLARALSIGDGNWITGIGLYDPDGGGGAGPYLRLFLIQVEETGS